MGEVSADLVLDVDIDATNPLESGMGADEFRVALTTYEALAHLVTIFGDQELNNAHVFETDEGESHLVILHLTSNDIWSATIYSGDPQDLDPLFVVAELFCDATNNGRGPRTEEDLVAPPSAVYKPLHRGMPEVVAAID